MAVRRRLRNPKVDRPILVSSLDNMNNIFGKKPNPREALRESKRELSHTTRVQSVDIDDLEKRLAALRNP